MILEYILATFLFSLSLNIGLKGIERVGLVSCQASLSSPSHGNQ